jgi:Fe-S cluster assembly iron-binding protein IscA
LGGQYEKTMIYLTGNARGEISRSITQGGKNPSLRIYVDYYDSREFSLSLLFDRPTKNDEIIRENDFSLIIEKRLHSKLGDINIDFQPLEWPSEGRFSIKSSKKP